MGKILKKKTKQDEKGSQEVRNKEKIRCGKCMGCQNPVCNECKYCLDNQNEDGSKQRKQCLSKKCLGLIKRVAAENTLPSLKLSKKSTQGSSLGVFQSNDVVKWVLSAITSAICEHRWEDAATLLPAMILRHEGQITDDFMWRVIDTVSSNAESIPDGTKNKLRRLMVRLRKKDGPDSKHVRCGSMDMHEKVVLDSLAQELTKSDNVDDLKDEVQKLEMILEMRENKGKRMDPAQSHVGALVIAYRGVFLYSKWKFLKMNISKKEANQERKLQDDTVSSSEEMNLSMWKSAHSVFGGVIQNQQDSIDSKVVGIEALNVLKSSLEKLKEPCEFALGPYLELQFEINGPEATLEIIEEYRRKYPDHLPGKKLLYYVLSAILCSEKTLQVELLKEICSMCDQDPLVLVYVDQLIQKASTKENLSHFQQVEHDNPDSGLEDFSDNSADESEEEENKQEMLQTFTHVGINSAEYVCSLQPDGYIECLLLCVGFLSRFLEYPQFRDHLPAWQKLTLVLKRLHHAWLRCWYCAKCEESKKKFRVIRRKVNCLWKFIIWNPPSNDLSQEEAQVLMNKAYAAHVFCFSEDYILQATAALVKSGCSYLAKELLGYINFSALHTEKFKAYRNKRRASYAFHKRPTFGMNEIQQMFGITKASSIQKKDESIKLSTDRIKSPANMNTKLIIAIDGSCDISEGESIQSDRADKESDSSDRIQVECDGYLEMSRTTSGSNINVPLLDCNINNDENKERDDDKVEGYPVVVEKPKTSDNIHIFSQFANEKSQTSQQNSSNDTLKEREDKGETLSIKALEIKSFALDVRETLQKLEITLTEIIENSLNNFKISGIYKKSDLTKFFTYSHPIHRMEKIKNYLENVIAEKELTIKNNGTSQNIQSQEKLEDTSINFSFNDSDLDNLPMPSQLDTESNVNLVQKIQPTEDETEGRKLFSDSLLFDENLFITSTQIQQKDDNSNELMSNELKKNSTTNSNTFQLIHQRESLEKSYDTCNTSFNQYEKKVKAQNYEEKADESDGEYEDDLESDSENFNKEFKPIGTIYPAGLSKKAGDKITDKEITPTTNEIEGGDASSLSRIINSSENIESNRSQDMCKVGPHASSGTVYLKHGQQLVLAGAVDVHHYQNDNNVNVLSQCNDLPVNSQINHSVEEFKQPKSQLPEKNAVNNNIDDNEKRNIPGESSCSVRSRSESDLDMTVEEEQFDPYSTHNPLTHETKSGFNVHSSIQLSKIQYDNEFERNRKSNIKNKLSLSSRSKNRVTNIVEDNLDNEALSNTQSSIITCGQRDQKSISTNKASSSSRNSSSGYKAGSSGEHEISPPVSQDLNDSSVFFQYTELPPNLPSSPLLDLDISGGITSIPESQELSQDVDNNHACDMEKLGVKKTNFDAVAALSFIPGNEELDILNNTLDTSIPITCGQRESFNTSPQDLDDCADDQKNSCPNLLLNLNDSSEINTLSNDEEFYSSKSAAASDDGTIISDSCSEPDISDNRFSENHCYSALTGLRPNESKIGNDDCLNDVSSQFHHEIEIVTQDDNFKESQTKVIGESNDPVIFDHSPVKPTKPFKVLKVRYPEGYKNSSAKHFSDDETDDETDDENANKILEILETLKDNRNVPQNDNLDSNSDIFFTATEDEGNLYPDSQNSIKERENIILDKNVENENGNEQKIKRIEVKKRGNIEVNLSHSNEQRKVLQTQNKVLVSQNIKKKEKKNKDILSVEEDAYKNRSIDEGNFSSRIKTTEYQVECKEKKKKSSKKNQDVLSLEEELYKDSPMIVQEEHRKIKKKKKKKFKERSPNKREEPNIDCINKDDLDDTSINKGRINSKQNTAIQNESETPTSLTISEDNEVHPKKKMKKDYLKNKDEICNDMEDVQEKDSFLNRNEVLDRTKEKSKKKKKKKKNRSKELEEIDDKERNNLLEEDLMKSKKNVMKMDKDNDKDTLILSDFEAKNKDDNEDMIKSKKAKKKKKEKLLLVNSRNKEKSVQGTKFQSPVSESNRKESKNVSRSSCENYETCEEDQDLVEYINETNNVENNKYLDKTKCILEKLNNVSGDNSNIKIMQAKTVGKGFACTNEMKSPVSKDYNATNDEVDNVRQRFDLLKQKRNEKRDPSNSIERCTSFSETPEGVEIKAEITGVVGKINDWLSDELFNIQSGNIIGSDIDENKNLNKTIEIDIDSFADDEHGIDVNETIITKDNSIIEESETGPFVTKIKKNNETKKIKKEKKKKTNSMIKNPISDNMTNLLSTPIQCDGIFEEKQRSSNKKLKKKCEVSTEIKGQSIGKLVKTTEESPISKKEKKRKNIVIAEINEKQDKTKYESKSKKIKKRKYRDISENEEHHLEMTGGYTSKEKKKKKNMDIPESEDKQDETDIESTSKKIKKKKCIVMSEKENEHVEISGWSMSKKEKKKKHIIIPETEDEQAETADESVLKKGKKRKHIDMAEIENKQKEITRETVSKKVKKIKKISKSKIEDTSKFTGNELKRSNLLVDEPKQKKTKKKNDSMVQIPKSIINEYLSPQKSSVEIKKLKKSKKSNKQQQSTKSDISSDVEHLFSMPIASLKNIVDEEKKNKLKLKISSTKNTGSQNKTVFQGDQKSKESVIGIYKSNKSNYSDDLDDLPFFSDDEIVQLFDNKYIIKEDDNLISRKKENKNKKKMCSITQKSLDVTGCHENSKADTKHKPTQREEKRKPEVEKLCKTKKNRKSIIEDELNGELSCTSTDVDKYFNDSDLDDLPFPNLDEILKDKHSYQKIDNSKKKLKKSLLDSCDNKNSKGEDFVTPITDIKSNKKNSKSRVTRLRQDSFKEDLSPILPPSTIRKHKLFSPEKAELFSSTPPIVPLSD